MVRFIKMLGFGEAMVEHSSGKKSFAGDIINCLKTAELLGIEASFLSQFGNDDQADDLLQFLQEQDIHVPLCLRTDAKTGSYSIHLDKTGERTFSYDREGSAASLIDEDQVNASILNDMSLFYLSGISMAISQSAKRTGKKLVQLASDRNIPVAYDVNYRPQLQTLEQASNNLRVILERIDYCFLSEDDIPVMKRAIKFVEVLGENLDQSKADYQLLALLKKKYNCNGIIKKGAQGAFTLDSCDDLIHSLNTEVKAVDTSGAGDVFNGVFLAEILQHNEISVALDTAAKIAGLHIERAGAFPPSRIIS